MSDAEKNQKILDAELSKPTPDPDIVYALQSSRHMWNTHDSEKSSAGWDKIRAMYSQDALQSALDKIATKNINKLVN